MGNISHLQDDQPKVTFLNCLAGISPFGLAGLTYGGASAIITLAGRSSILSLVLGYAFASPAFAGATYRLMGDELGATLRRLTLLKVAPARVTSYRGPAWHARQEIFNS